MTRNKHSIDLDKREDNKLPPAKSPNLPLSSKLQIARKQKEIGRTGKLPPSFFVQGNSIENLVKATEGAFKKIFIELEQAITKDLVAEKKQALLLSMHLQIKISQLSSKYSENGRLYKSLWFGRGQNAEGSFWPQNWVRL